MATINTQTKIALTLTELIKHKNVDDITIQELSDACGISRQTFYYYFTDITDVAEFYARMRVEKIIAECDNCDHPNKALQILVSSCCSETKIIYQLLHSSLGFKYYDIFFNTIKIIINKTLTKRISTYSVTLGELDFTVDFLTNALFGTCMQYGSKADLNIDDFIQKTDKLLQSCTKSLVGLN